MSVSSTSKPDVLAFFSSLPVEGKKSALITIRSIENYLDLDTEDSKKSLNQLIANYTFTAMEQEAKEAWSFLFDPIKALIQEPSSYDCARVYSRISLIIKELIK